MKTATYIREVTKYGYRGESHLYKLSEPIVDSDGAFYNFVLLLNYFVFKNESTAAYPNAVKFERFVTVCYPSNERGEVISWLFFDKSYLENEKSSEKSLFKLGYKVVEN